jgi:hypothetical protein
MHQRDERNAAHRNGAKIRAGGSSELKPSRMMKPDGYHDRERSTSIKMK